MTTPMSVFLRLAAALGTGTWDGVGMRKLRMDSCRRFQMLGALPQVPALLGQTEYLEVFQKEGTEVRHR
jgi:hypothetical protein